MTAGATERAQASGTAASGTAGLLCDRDGTLIDDTGYPTAGSPIRLLPGVGPALRALADAGAVICIVSNQSGVGRGLLTEADVWAVDAGVRIGLQAHGVHVAASYYCFHSPDDGCECRKPAPGLLRRALHDLQLQPEHCALVGDRATDLAAAAAAGVAGFDITTSSWAELLPALHTVLTEAPA